MGVGEQKPNTCRYVNRTISSYVLTADENRPLFRTLLSYDRRDPFAVKCDFGGGTQPWILGRYLLIDGCEMPTGNGDVHIELIKDPHVAKALLSLELSSPFGHASLGLSLEEVGGFIAATLKLVPLEQEVPIFNELFISEFRQHLAA